VKPAAATREVSGDLVAIQRNPTSGSGRGRAALRELIRELKCRGYSVRLFSNRGRMDDFVQQVGEHRPIRCLVAAGGDGTVRDLFSRHPERPIAVLPMGTENLIARHLQIPRNGLVVADVVDRGQTKLFDTAENGDERFLIMASAGFDADIVRRLHAQRTGNIHHLSYIRPILETLAGYRYPAIRVENVDTGESVIGMYVIVGNFKEYGLNLKLTPAANPTDGQLNVCVFTGRSAARTVIHFLLSFFRIQRGDFVVRFQTQHVRLVPVSQSLQSPLIPLQTDGDAAGTLPVDLQVLPGSMQLLVRP
jgi:diacylglycerol kinase (ATP)